MIFYFQIFLYYSLQGFLMQESGETLKVVGQHHVTLKKLNGIATSCPTPPVSIGIVLSIKYNVTLS